MTSCTWWLLLLGCPSNTGDSDSDPDSDSDSETGTVATPTGTTGDTGPTTGGTPTTADTGGAHTGGDAVPMIDEVLEARCPNVDPTPVVPAGNTLHRVTLSGSDAVCNDGSTPVLYVREATDPAHADDWILYLDSGASCGSGERCAERWCGEGPIYDAGKMSTRWAPETMGGGGILGTSSQNDFAGWNAVLAYYCSSDQWTGTRRNQVYEDAADGPFRVHHLGHEILVDAVDALKAGVVTDDGSQSPRSLADADTVLFAGSSAGALGATEHADWMVDQLPSARVMLVVDSWFVWGSPEAQGSTVTTQTDSQAFNLWTQAMDPFWESWLDRSCLAAPDDDARCIDMDHLLRDHVDVPFVLHHDLFDPDSYGTFYSPLGLDRLEYRDIGIGTLEQYADLGASVHGATCQLHTSIDDDARFFGITVEQGGPGGPERNFHDVVASAVAGAPMVVIDGIPERSTCP